MPLSNRIAFLVVSLLAAAGFFAGVGFYQAVHRALVAELDGRLDSRLAWLEGALEMDEHEIELEALERPEPADAAEYWQVATAEGGLLWSSKGDFDASHMVSRSRTLRLGAGGDSSKESRMDISPMADTDTHSEHHDARAYRRPPGSRGLDLVLVAGSSSLGMGAELSRLTRALWTVGPLALLGCGGLLVLAIRRQLRPLEQMAAQAGHIGPGDLAARIGSVGTSRECVGLRDAINAMVGRLAEGLERERQFASSAAHELRTPVAQLRTQIEVSLRRERTADEYQDALRNTLADVERLQKLVTGLLQLTRSQQPDMVTGHSVSVAKVVEAVAAKAAFEKESAPVPDLRVEGEEALLCAALQNVLENAHRYAPAKPPSLAVELEGEQVLLIISDHGLGVAEEDRERIFLPLTRLDSSRSIGESADGFGLGLTVARATVRAFGGDLTCRARRDGAQGAEFVIRLRGFSENRPAGRASHRGAALGGGG